MPRHALPSTHVPGTACVRVLPAGTLLWRLHESLYPADSFAPPRDDPIFAGARFDGTILYPYSYYYASERPETALAEVLLRRREFSDGVTTRLISRREVAGRRLSAVLTAADLRLVSLISARDLAAVSQDDWLLNTDGEGWAHTRAWAGQLWSAETGAQGLVWTSRRNMPERVLMLFGGRCGPAPLEACPHLTLDLDLQDGIDRANALLRPLRAAIGPAA